MDCVLGYHLNPLSCGIAKFNLALARQMSVPVLSLFDPSAASTRRPLLSIKLSEFTYNHARDLERFLNERPATQSLRLFLHAFDDTELERRMVMEADLVCVGNIELAERLRSLRPDVVEAWCPGAVFDAAPFTPTELSVFTFGMAHKVRGEHYRRLDELLQQTGKSYSLYLSTALHEGTTIETAFSSAVESIRQHFTGPVHFLGFLSDAAVMHYLRTTTYFAAFFGEGVRANNTSVHTAMQAGAVVVTNMDDRSPEGFDHMQSVIDIRSCSELPTSAEVLRRISSNAQKVFERYGWDRLVRHLIESDERPNVAQRAAPGAGSHGARAEPRFTSARS
jgi:hypothetical protein